MNKKIFIIFIAFFCLFLVSSCKEPIDDDIGNDPVIITDPKSEYHVKLLNGQIESGASDMYEFYQRTKDGEKLIVKIETEYEAEYLNSVKAIYDDEVTEGRKYLSEIIFNGEDYEYYQIEDNVRSLKGHYQYFNYSKTLSTNGRYTYMIGYVLSDKEDMTADKYLQYMLSSDSRVFEYTNNTTLVLSYGENHDLYFNNSKILSMSYEDKKGNKQDYYSNVISVNKISNILNVLEWKKDDKELSGLVNNGKKHEKLTVNMSRTLVYDRYFLIPIDGNSDNTYLLRYVFYFDIGVVSMGYLTLSTSSHNLYARISDEDIEIIRGLLDDDLVKLFTFGSYSVTSYKTSDEPCRYTVELRENSEAIIYKRILNLRIPFVKLIASGEYEIINEKEKGYKLVIRDGDYRYKFGLTEKENKGIYFIGEESCVSNEFMDDINDMDNFMYITREYENNDSLVVMRINSYGNKISSTMKAYAQKTGSSYSDDVLNNITPSDLNGLVNIYKYEKSAASFLEFDGEIYEMGLSFGGHGVTHFAYYHSEYENILYFICSFGSGIHRSLIMAFDFNMKKMYFVNCSIDYFTDIEFESKTNENGELELAIYKAQFDWSIYPYFYTSTKEELLYSNILDLNLVN